MLYPRGQMRIRETVHVLHTRMAECRGVDFPSLARWLPQTGLFACANSKVPLARRHTLVSTEARHLDRWTFQIGAGVRSDELAVEPPVSLSPDQNHKRSIPVQAKWSAWQDLHLQPFRSERDASAVGLTRHGNWCIRQDGLPKPYKLDSPNGTARYREL